MQSLKEAIRLIFLSWEQHLVFGLLWSKILLLLAWYEFKQMERSLFSAKFHGLQPEKGISSWPFFFMH
jgi:hypothetical protein